MKADFSFPFFKKTLMLHWQREGVLMRMAQCRCLLFYSVLPDDLIPFHSVKASLTCHAKN